MNRRALHKAAIELVPVIGLVIAGFAIDNAAELGIGSGALFVLLQVRRALRDASQGEPF